MAKSLKNMGVAPILRQHSELQQVLILRDSSYHGEIGVSSFFPFRRGQMNGHRFSIRFSLLPMRRIERDPVRQGCSASDGSPSSRSLALLGTEKPVAERPLASPAKTKAACSPNPAPVVDRLQRLTMNAHPRQCVSLEAVHGHVRQVTGMSANRIWRGCWSNFDHSCAN
jgi:hypothetical protein